MPQKTEPAQQTVGAVYTFFAYAMWGFMPVYFLLMLPSTPMEIVAWRMVFSLVVCLILVTILRSWPALRAIMRQPRLLLLTALAGALIYINWQVYLIGALSERIIETSLGYFTNPIFTVLLGVFILHERLRIVQWIAVGLAAVAVAVIVIGYGDFPWIALTLASSFALYGFVKKQIGPAVDALSGLTLESLWLLPVAGVLLAIVAGTGEGITFGAVSAGHTLIMLSAGIVTAAPLLLFAAGARRVPLSVIGFLQFLAPLTQFAIGTWIMHEPMPAERWIGFGLVWLALVLLTTDLLVHSRRSRKAGRGEDAVSDLDRAWTGATPLPK